MAQASDVVYAQAFRFEVDWERVFDGRIACHIESFAAVLGTTSELAVVCLLGMSSATVGKSCVFAVSDYELIHANLYLFGVAEPGCGKTPAVKNFIEYALDKTSSYVTGHVMSRLVGKVAVVTASTAGIGFEIAKRLSVEGASVIISSRKQANVDNAVAKLKSSAAGEIIGIPCHAEEKFGKLDILVSNAGINPHAGDLLDCTEDMWDKIFDVNVKAAFLLSKEAMPLMKRAGGGSIVYVSSFTAYNSLAVIPAYSVSKTALLGLTKAMADACAPHGVRVNCLAPGIIKTDFSKALWSNPSMESELMSHVPLGRVGRPEECAGAVAFLVSDDASYVTGETVAVTGGIKARL